MTSKKTTSPATKEKGGLDNGLASDDMLIVTRRQLFESLWITESDEEALELLELSDINPEQIDAHNEQGFSLLAMCATKGFTKSALALIQWGADPNARSHIGEGPLALAAICGHLKTFKALLSVGADASEIDNDGNNIVHKLVDSRLKKGQEMLMLAIENGADHALKNKRGMTAFKMLQNLGVHPGDARYATYEHLSALGESMAIAKGLEPISGRVKAHKHRL